MVTFISAALVPITWVLVQKYIAEPISKIVIRYLPKNIASALTKKRFE